MHWKAIHWLLNKHSMIFFGDIKTHNIVKENPNNNLNKIVNDIKFYQFKQKLAYKCKAKNVFVKMVPEHYTTKTCSFCGEINENVGDKKIFHCDSCNSTYGRDNNAAKNILMKGILI